MVYAIFPQLVIVLSLLGIIVILGRKLPKVKNLDVIVKTPIQKKEARDLSKSFRLTFKKLGSFFVIFATKLGRAAKVLFGKIIKTLGRSKDSLGKIWVKKKRQKTASPDFKGQEIKQELQADVAKKPLATPESQKAESKSQKPSVFKRRMSGKVSPSRFKIKGRLPQDQSLSADELLTRAQKLARMERLDEAESTCIDMIYKDPNNIQVYKILGNVYLKQGNIQDAESSFKEALRRGAQEIEIYKKLGSLYTDQGKIKEAIRIYRRAIKNKLAKEYFYLELGRAYRKRGQFGKAVQIYEDLVREYPGNFKYIELLEKQKKRQD